jgi:aminoglycoside 6'-N-acetyltransferase
MEIVGDLVRLRTATVDDVPRVIEILTSPSVAEWWGDYTVEKLEKELKDPKTHHFVIEVDGRSIGFIQWWEEPEPEFRHAGIDIALADSVQDKGLGTDAVRTLARHVTREVGHHRVTIDPAAANTRAIRCYEKVGFKRVGVMRSYGRRPDGSWYDGLLMDLLADELE